MQHQYKRHKVVLPYRRHTKVCLGVIIVVQTQHSAQLITYNHMLACTSVGCVLWQTQAQLRNLRCWDWSIKVGEDTDTGAAKQQVDTRENLESQSSCKQLLLTRTLSVLYLQQPSPSRCPQG